MINWFQLNFFSQSKLPSWAGKLWTPERKICQRRFPARISSGSWPNCKIQQLTRKIPPGLFFPMASVPGWAEFPILLSLDRCLQPASPWPPSGSVWALGCFGHGLVSCQKEIVLAAPEGHFSCLQAWMLRVEHSNRAFSTCSQALRVSVSASESSWETVSVRGTPQHLPFLKTNALFF